MILNKNKYIIPKYSLNYSSNIYTAITFTTIIEISNTCIPASSWCANSSRWMRYPSTVISTRRWFI